MEYVGLAGDVLTNYFHRTDAASEEEIELEDREKQPLAESADPPPAYPSLIIAFQGLQQIGTFGFGVSTGLMLSSSSPAPYCNVTFPENQPNCTDYNCTITEPAGSHLGISLTGTILGIVCCTGGAVGAYLVTKNFLNTVKLKNN